MVKLLMFTAWQRFISLLRGAFWFRICFVCLVVPAAGQDSSSCKESTYRGQDVNRISRCLDVFDALPERLKNRSFSGLSDGELIALKLHEDTCLESFDLLRCATRQAIRSSFGLLLKMGGGQLQPHCMAAILSERKITTASHCVEDFVGDAFFFSPFDAPLTTHRVSSVRIDAQRASGARSDLWDFATLELVTSLSGVRSHPPIMRHREVRYLVIPVFALATFRNAGGSIGDWSEFLRVDIGDSCYDVSLHFPLWRDNCILHGCQTTQTSSGSPIFAVDPKSREISLVGVHIRSGWLPFDDRGIRECGHHPRYGVGLWLIK